MNSNINYNSNYCLCRLPCGYCKELGRDCPKVSTVMNCDEASYNEKEIKYGD